jgi:hypothetical protein
MSIRTVRTRPDAVGTDRYDGGAGRTAFKIMTVVCHQKPRGTTGEEVTRENAKSSDCGDVVMSGDTNEHEI